MGFRLDYSHMHTHALHAAVSVRHEVVINRGYYRHGATPSQSTAREKCAIRTAPVLSVGFVGHETGARLSLSPSLSLSLSLVPLPPHTHIPSNQISNSILFGLKAHIIIS